MCGVGILSDWMYECTSDVQQKFEFKKKNFLNKFEHTAAVNCKILSIASSVINWIYNVDIYNIDTWLTNHLIIWLQQVVTSSGWSFWSDFYEQVISKPKRHDDIYYLRRGRGCMICVVCLPLCLVLWAGLLQKLSANFTETWRYDWAYQSEELVNFWWWSGPKIRILDHFSTSLPHCHRIGDFRRFMSISHAVTGQFSRQCAQWLTLTK